MKVAADLEPSGLFNPADLDRLEACRSDQALNLAVGSLSVGRVEEHRQLW